MQQNHAVSKPLRAKNSSKDQKIALGPPALNSIELFMGHGGAVG